MDRREFFNKKAGVVGAAVAGGLAFEASSSALSGPEKNKELDLKIKEEIEKFKQVFYENKSMPMLAKQEVIGGNGLNRHTYLHEYFKDNKARYIPDSVRLHIANLVNGLAAEESKYHNGLKSPVGAAGILQIMPRTYFDTEGHNNKHTWESVKKSMKEQVEFSFKYLDETVYRHLNESENAIPLEKVCAQFKLDKTESDVFSALVILNSYNAGAGNMVNIINKFCAAFPSSEELPKSFNHTGLGLFYILINTALDPTFSQKEPPSKSYGMHARNYVLKVLAATEVLNKELGTSYGINLNPNENKERESKISVAKIIGAGIVGIGTGLLTGMAIKQIPILETEERTANNNMSRKDFLVTTGILAGAGIIGGNIVPTIKSFNDSVSSEKEYAKIQGAEFPDGTVYNPDLVKNKLEAFYLEKRKILPNTNFNGSIADTYKKVDAEMPTTNYESSGFKTWFKDTEKKGHIKKYTSENQIVTAVEEGKLSQVVEVNDFWRCCNVKGGHVYDDLNHPSYLSLHPEGLQLLKKITQKFQDNLVAAGIDTLIWRIRPKIESLIRDAKVNNGSDLSPHQFGLGIDFPKKNAFDLIHMPDKTFMVIKESENESLYKTIEIIFMKTLQEISEQKNILLTSEVRPPHFHIAVKIAE